MKSKRVDSLPLSTGPCSLSRLVNVRVPVLLQTDWAALDTHVALCLFLLQSPNTAQTGPQGRHGSGVDRCVITNAPSLPVLCCEGRVMPPSQGVVLMNCRDPGAVHTWWALWESPCCHSSHRTGLVPSRSIWAGNFTCLTCKKMF